MAYSEEIKNQVLSDIQAGKKVSEVAMKQKSIENKETVDTQDGRE